MQTALTFALRRPLPTRCLSNGWLPPRCVNALQHAVRLLLALIFASTATAAPRVEAVGMFNGGAVLVIDGQQRMLRVGESSPEGCRLLNASAQHCTVQCKGAVSQKLTLSNRVGGHYAVVQRPVVRVPADQRGQYHVQGAINGAPVEMLVDTGASVLAISAVQAASLGIVVPHNAREGLVATAQGRARAREVILSRVEVGGIVVQNVRAAIVDGAFPEAVLLGMSFLQAVSIEHSAGMMVLSGR